MKEDVLRRKIKEDLVILGILNYQNIKGFRCIFGRNKDNLTIDEIVDSIGLLELETLRDLIGRTFSRQSTAT